MRGFCEDHNVPKRACGSLMCLWLRDEDRAAQLRATDEGGGSHGTVPPGLGVVAPLGRCGFESVLRESHLAGDGDAALMSSDCWSHRYRQNVEAPSHPGRDGRTLVVHSCAGSALQRTGEKFREGG